jgi:Domain of unknown function (DUF6285)
MSIPSSSTLSQVALDYLELELLPSLQGEHKFKTRVAINALRIAQREAAHPPRASAAHERDRELVQQIRSAQISTDDPALRAYLRKSLREALVINNPKWLDRP